MIAALLLVLGAAVALLGCRGPDEPRVSVAGDLERGRTLIASYGCGTCHEIPGVAGARGRVGPPLWGIADRAYIGGVLPNTEADMVRWLRDPPAVDPRTAMPNMAVTEDDARDIAAYLFTLRAEPAGMRMLRGFLERGTGHQVPNPRGVLSRKPE